TQESVNEEIILFTPNKNITIFITYKYPAKKTRDVVLTENQDLNIYGISFTLRNSAIIAKKEKEIKSFPIPGTYYINILLDGSLESGETFSPFEGIIHPNTNEYR
ncbi:MAG: hypothetical protein RR807_09410, partial [Oscillospiraceae bacterium]